MAAQPLEPDSLNDLLASLATVAALTELAVLFGCLALSYALVRLVRGPVAPEASVWFGRRIVDGVLFPVLALALAYAARLALAGGACLGCTFGSSGNGLGRHFLNHRLRTASGKFLRLVALVALMALRAALIHAFAIIAVTIIVVVAVFALEPLLHLRLGGSNDAVVVFSMLKIIFSHDAVAGTLRVPCEVLVLFGNMLSCATDLYVRTGAVIGPGQRVLALAVEVATAAAAATATTAAAIVTPSTTLILLSWPHR